MQLDVMRRALAVLRDAQVPGEIVELDYRWADDDTWKVNVMRKSKVEAAAASRPESQLKADDDDRTERLDTPQYQNAADEAAADPNCQTCIWLGAD